MPGSTTEEQMRHLLDGADFYGLFLGLGWDNPPDTGPVQIVNTGLTARPVATKKGVAVWLVVWDAPPHGLEKRRVSLALRKYSPMGRLVLFDTPEEVLFLWPERTQSGWDRLVEHVYPKGSGGGNAVLQRLERVRFTLADQATLTTLNVLDRMRLSFNVEKVTRSFYREFQSHHKDLVEHIEGISDEKDRDWYASVLLNRLMFIYFIQRKRFLDGDQSYLRNQLTKVRELFGTDQPFTFFREFLLPLFHQGLGHPNPQYDNSTIECLVGSLPYVNGGIFETHQLEDEYDIYIEDKAFERLFKFFDKWRWHLDENPTGASNEISPHILGFIFEQSINQKEIGAYYTKPDVTRYMVTSSIIPAIIDRLVAAGLEDPCILLASSGADYIHKSLGYGVHKSLPQGELNPAEKPDCSLDIALPGERWCDVLYRRQWYDNLVERLSDKEIEWTIDDLVTYNLDLTTLMDDYLSLLSSKKEIETAFEVLRSLNICDPTVGSGAFLLAAVELLDPMYTAVIETARYFNRASDNKENEITFLAEASVYTSERYWMLKTACLNNLYGVDLIAEAAEITKLRLFLKLVAQLDNISQVEPLPDLDFNIRVGNLLVGLADSEDAVQRFGDRLPLSDLDLARHAAEMAADAYKDFIKAQSTDIENGPTLSTKRKQQLETKVCMATHIADSALHQMRNEQPSLSNWRSTHQPFHWFTEFPAVWQQKGFDVIIGNPPYINTKGKRKTEINYSWYGYSTQYCPDIYAVCTERASSLLNDQGRLAMIVMHSLCFNDKFSTLRDFLIKQFPSLWISSYANIPDGLFSGSASVRNSIIIGSRRGKTGLLTTRCRRWTAISRETMFNGVKYIHPHNALLHLHGKPKWPFVDDLNISDAFCNLINKNTPLSANLAPNKRYINGPALYYKDVARYVLGVANTPPPALIMTEKL